jgi:hypothetical protein
MPSTGLLSTVALPLQVSVVGASQTISGITVSAKAIDVAETITTSGACASIGCSFTSQAPDGNVQLTITLTNGTAVVLSGTVNLDASEGLLRTPQLVFGAAPAKVVLSAEPAELRLGLASGTTLSALAYDSLGRRIIGSAAFASPIAVTSSDATGTTTLSGASITAPSQTLTVNYNGGVLANGVSFSGSTSGASVTAVSLSVDEPPGVTSNGHGTGDAKMDSAEMLASIPAAPDLPPTLANYRRPLSASSVDLSANFPPAGDQDGSSNCGVFSAVYGIRTYFENVERAKLAAPWILTGSGAWGENDRTAFSPTFTYNQASVNGGKDDGVALETVARSLREVGAVPLSVVGWTPKDPLTNFVPKFAGLANSFRIASYETIDVNDLAKLKRYLAAGFPIYFAVDVDDAMGGLTAANAVWNGPYDGGKLGGHAMVIVGYDDNFVYPGGTGAFKILNSWSNTWGNGGYAMFTYNWWSNGIQSRETLVFTPNAPDLNASY